MLELLKSNWPRGYWGNITELNNTKLFLSVWHGKELPLCKFWRFYWTLTLGWLWHWIHFWSQLRALAQGGVQVDSPWGQAPVNFKNWRWSKLWKMRKSSFEFSVKIGIPTTLILRNRFLLSSRIYVRCVNRQARLRIQRSGLFFLFSSLALVWPGFSWNCSCNL